MFQVTFEYFNNLFLISFIESDEENVEDETRKHKSHYFPTQKNKFPKKQFNSQSGENSIPNSTTYNMQKPVNFLFSNELDSMDDASND